MALSLNLTSPSLSTKSISSASKTTFRRTRVYAVQFAERPAAAALPLKWSVDSWRSKKALQLPEYPNKKELDEVLKTIASFPPIVFAGEARHLEEKLGEAAMGRAFLLQGGDCAESFKEFNANNIRDTFRILLQMGVVLMFGGQVPVIKSLYNILEGVLHGKKDYNLANHPLIDVPNLEVITLMQIFLSMQETLAWEHYYWYLTKDGIESLRT